MSLSYVTDLVSGMSKTLWRQKVSLSCVKFLVGGMSKTQPKLYILAPVMPVLRSERFYFSARSKDEKCVFVTMKLCV